jgi:hypothetical protein
MTDQPTDRRIVEQTTRNLALAEQFLADVLADESILDSVPEEARIVLVPSEGDPELGRMNFEMAVREMMHGRPVVIQRVGGLTPEAKAWRATDKRQILMHEVRFPTAAMHADDVRIVFDQARDTLLVDYFGGRRIGWPLPVTPHVMLRIDPENHEVVGYLIASYLQAEAFRSPVLARALRKAEFRPITDEELGDIEIMRSGKTPFDDDEAADVASAFIHMITPRQGAPRMERDSA